VELGDASAAIDWTKEAAEARDRIACLQLEWIGGGTEGDSVSGATDGDFFFFFEGNHRWG
jgi:hypothetical protein